MKKIISVILAVLMLTSTVVFSSSSSDNVRFYLKTDNYSVNANTFTVDLVAHMPKNSEVTQIGLNIIVPEGIKIKSYKKVYTDEGMYTCSPDMNANPFMVLWISGTSSLPQGTDTTLVRFTFEVVSALSPGDKMDIGLDLVPGNDPIDTNLDYVYAEYSGCTVVCTDPILSFNLETDTLYENSTTIDVDLTVTLPKNATGYELGYFCVEINYDSSVMKLQGKPEWRITEGNRINSNDLTDNPYMFMWISNDEEDQFSPGKNIIATMTFELTKPTVRGDVFEIELLANEKNFVGTMPSQDGRYEEKKYSEYEVFFTGITVNTQIIYGDANRDSNVTISDAAEILRYIARWDGVSIDTGAADVNLDGDVTLTDVSRILRYIAKWNGIVLGTK